VINKQEQEEVGKRYAEALSPVHHIRSQHDMTNHSQEMVLVVGLVPYYGIPQQSH